MPIGRPSTAVKPIVLATLRPPAIAHMLAPLPRCSTTVLPRGRASRRCCGSTLRDVLVRQAVEAVAPHAALGDRRGQRERLRDRGLVAMERGVEAGDLRQLRRALEQRPDRRQVVRLVQRRERHVFLERRDAPPRRRAPAARTRGRRARRDGRRRRAGARQVARAGRRPGGRARRRGRAARPRPTSSRR